MYKYISGSAGRNGNVHEHSSGEAGSDGQVALIKNKEMEKESHLTDVAKMRMSSRESIGFISTFSWS